MSSMMDARNSDPSISCADLAVSQQSRKNLTPGERVIVYPSDQISSGVRVSLKINAGRVTRARNEEDSGSGTDLMLADNSTLHFALGITGTSDGTMSPVIGLKYTSTSLFSLLEP